MIWNIFSKKIFLPHFQCQKTKKNRVVPTESSSGILNSLQPENAGVINDVIRPNDSVEPNNFVLFSMQPGPSFGMFNQAMGGFASSNTILNSMQQGANLSLINQAWNIGYGGGPGAALERALVEVLKEDLEEF